MFFPALFLMHPKLIPSQDFIFIFLLSFVLLQRTGNRDPAFLEQFRKILDEFPEANLSETEFSDQTCPL